MDKQQAAPVSPQLGFKPGGNHTHVLASGSIQRSFNTNSCDIQAWEKHLRPWTDLHSQYIVTCSRLRKGQVTYSAPSTAKGEGPWAAGFKGC